MISWGAVLSTGLKIVLFLIDWAKSQQLINEGWDKAIGTQAIEITRKTEFGKDALETLAAMPDADLDDVLRQLSEPDDSRPAGGANAPGGR